MGFTISDAGVLSHNRKCGYTACVFLAVLLLGRHALASDLTHASNEPSALPLIEFSIKPRLCVLTAGEEQCTDQLQVSWRAPVARSLCLYQSDKPEPLRCWQAQTQGDYAFELSASANTHFELRETATGIALGDQQFHVVYNDKKYRRVRRNPWSFF